MASGEFPPRPGEAMRHRRVVIYSWMDVRNPRAGGDARYLGEIAKRLARDELDVVWVTSRFHGSEEKCVYDGYTILRVGSIRTVYLAHHLSRRVADFLPCDVTVEVLSSIPFFLRRTGSHGDLLYINHVVPFSQMLRKVGPLAVIAFALDRIVAPVIYRRRRVLVPSKATELEVKKLGYEKVRTFRNGIDTPQGPGVMKEHLIVAPGPIKPWKRHADIIRALRNTDRDWKLTIFGHYESAALERRLRNLAKDLGVADRVLFSGRVSNEEKLKILERASICVIASEKEGWGMAAVEAQAFGCPVIAYDVPGLRETVRHLETGLLVSPHEPGRLAAGISLLIKDPDLLDKMKAAASQFGQAYDWESSYRDFLSHLGP